MGGACRDLLALHSRRHRGQTPPEIEGYLIDRRAAFFAADTIKATLSAWPNSTTPSRGQGLLPSARADDREANTSSPSSRGRGDRVSRGHVGCMSEVSSPPRSARRSIRFMRTGRRGARAGSPPGTGKTTMLQSVVAQLLVDAALRKTECP